MGLIPRGALSVLRGTTEASMVDRCIITRRSPVPPTYNTVTRAYTDAPPSTIYNGPCRIRYGGGGSTDTETAGEHVELREYGATILADTDDIVEGDIFTVTSSDDAQLVDRHLYVIAVRWSTENLHRRLVLSDRQI